MKNIANSLTFKIGMIIILAEMIIFFIAGFIIVERLSNEVDQRFLTQLQNPAFFFHQNSNNLTLINEKDTLNQLAGMEIEYGHLVNHASNIILQSTEEDLVGSPTEAIPGANSNWFSGGSIDTPHVFSTFAQTTIISPLNQNDEPKTNLYLIIAASRSNLNSEKRGLVRLVILSALLIIGFTSLVLYVSFRWLILSRLTAVLAVLNQAENGHLDARVSAPINTDEIGNLQRNVNSLIAQLQETVETLTRRIAELRLTEEALRESEEKYRDFVEGTDDLITQVDKTGQFIYVNHTAEKIFGSSQEALIGQSAFEFIHPDDLERTEMAFLEWIRGQVTSATFENRQISLNGNIFTMLWTINVHYDQYGNVNYINSIARDITQRKKVEIELQSRIASLELIAQVGRRTTAILELDELLHQAVFLISDTFSYYNVVIRLIEDEYLVLKATSLPSLRPLEGQKMLKTGQGITGWVAQTGESLLVPDVSQEPRYHAELNAMETVSEVAVPIRLKDTIIGVLDTQSVLQGAFDEDDVFTLEAIAAQLAVAIENARLYKAAQQEILERRNAEEQLNIYTEELERSNRELENFAYVSSHDLQEPLRKIQMFGDRLVFRYQDELDERGLDYLLRMQNAASRMQVLIEDLLAFSRVITKADPFTHVRLNEILQEVVSDLEGRLEMANGRVNITELPIIKADATQMRQLFQNLISNALKYHNDGVPPQVEVQAKKLDHGLCEISVSDNGIGFEEKYLDRIFNVFQRLHGRSDYAGTGVGLAICKRIVERHGGTITARSQPGKGATFIVTLPENQDRSS